MATFFSCQSTYSTELAYVTNEKDDNISVIDLSENKVVKTIAVGQRPRGVIMNKDHTLAYICASDSDSIQILDLKNRANYWRITFGRRPRNDCFTS